MNLAVLMSVRNEASHIGGAIRSVLSQGSAFRPSIVVVDDGSTDETADIVASLAAADPRIILDRQPHKGIPATRNRSLELLPEDADWVAFLDGDDEFAPDRLQAEEALLKAHPDADVLVGAMQLVYRDDGPLAPVAGDEGNQQKLRSPQVSTALFRKSVLQPHVFDPDFALGEDSDLLFRVLETKPEFVPHDHVCLYYRQHEGNSSNDPAEKRRYLLKTVLAHTRRIGSDPDLAQLRGHFGQLD